MRVEAEALGARKFRDNQDTTGTPGQGPKFRDCPGHSGTVGNYVYIYNTIITILLYYILLYNTAEVM